MRVYLIDGTYELFRHFFGRPARSAEDGAETSAVLGVILSVVSLLADGATHVGVATDHVIESFRNQLWPGYKTGEAVAPELLAQFPLLEEALRSLGVKVWPMVELEADDALASAAQVAADDAAAEQVLICTPDKDLAQCVRGQLVVQLDRRTGRLSDDLEIRERFGVNPQSIPDWLALVGDSADGFPGIAGWGKRSASVVLSHYERLENIPASSKDWDKGVIQELRGAAKLSDRLRQDSELAYLFRDLATLRVDRTLLENVEQLRWKGPTEEFGALCQYLRMPELTGRVATLAGSRTSPD